MRLTALSVGLKTLRAIPLSWYLAGALVLALLYANHLRGEVAEAVALADSRATETDLAIDANQNNQQVIGDLNERLNACVGQAQMIQELANQAVADLAKARAERHKAELARRQDLEKIYADDETCAAWAAGAVCAGISDRL